MSLWTHVVAAYYIDTYKQDKNIKDYVEKLLENSPKITGSEGNADVFVNVKNGHNVWMSGDCHACPYEKTIVNLDEGGFTCEAEEGFKCPEGKYQTCVVITVVGNLRDKMKEKTKKELREFERYLKLKKKGCGFDIENKAVKIVGY